MAFSLSEKSDDPFFDQLRNQEYASLDKTGQVYLDYTGGNLCPRSLVVKHQNLLLENVLGNPHSTNPTSQRATALIESARNKVLDFFNADDYVCVFTSNASAALKLVGEGYPFRKASTLLLLSDNHNSVNGIREFCHQRGGTTTYMPVRRDDLQIDDALLIRTFNHVANEACCNLFAYPAQSNASGVKHDLKWIDVAQQKGFHVLLDAAAYVPTSKLDLSIVSPDFVSLSFYKMFGYPTGIGCLLIRKQSFNLLKKTWFAGGTVNLVATASQHKFLKDGHERFEDGTLNYNNIPAVEAGLTYLESIGMDRIANRVSKLVRYLIHQLACLKHDNGQPLVCIYGPKSFTDRGGNVMMRFMDLNGNPYPFEDIEQMTNAYGISIRSGCFCNPGLDEINSGLTAGDISSYFLGRSDVQYDDMKVVLNKIRGATRVSVGLPTTQSDIDTFVEAIRHLKHRPLARSGQTENSNRVESENITLPIRKVATD